MGGRGLREEEYVATITGLRQRVEWLEESMGRLLVSFQSPISLVTHPPPNFLEIYEDNTD